MRSATSSSALGVLLAVATLFATSGCATPALVGEQADRDAASSDEPGTSRSSADAAVERQDAADPRRSIAALVENVRGATRYRYATRDSAGATMDGLKVIESPAGGYLGVYHALSDDFVTKLATSIDLVEWTFRRDLEVTSSQPAIAALADGGFLVVLEKDRHDGDGAHLRFLYYASLANLMEGRASRDLDAPRSFSSCAEGTPNIEAVRLEPDIDRSTIDVGFHYYSSCDVDRQARGTLVNFASWSATRAPEIDAAVIAAAQSAGITLAGNIGDRDAVMLDGIETVLIEGGGSNADFASWRIYGYDRAIGSAVKLSPSTHGGSRAFANPTATALTSPGGRPALLVTLFIPSEGAAAGEAGTLLYYTER